MNDRLLQEFDWTQSPLGDRADWPLEINAVVDLVMASNFPMWTAWGDQHIQIYNDAYNDIFGAKHPASFGAPAQQSWPEIWEFLCPAMEQVKTTGKALWFVEMLLPLARASAPEESYFDFSYSPIRCADGTVAGILSVAAERTSEVILRRRQRLTELDVARDANNIDTLMQMLHDVLVENQMDCATAVLYSVASETAAPDGEVWALQASQDFVLKMRPLAARALRSRSIISEHTAAATTDAGRVPATCIPFHGLDGGPCCALVIVPNEFVSFQSSFLPFTQEISTRFHAVLHAAEQRQREIGQMREQIVEQEIVYRFLFDNIQDGVVYCATGGGPGDDEVILAANPRLCEMLGYDADELVGMSRDAIVFPDDGVVKDALEKRGKEQHFTGEIRFRGKDDQQLVAEVSSNLIEFRKGQTRSLSVVRDVSYRKKAEDERAERVRLETVATLAGSLTHDTNNLMTVVIGSIELLSERLPEGGIEQQMALNAMTAAERISGLTNQLLVYARQQPLEARPVDLNAFLAEIQPLITSALGEINTLTTNFEADLTPCLADPVQLTTSLLNLVTNARQAMPDGGSLKIETFRSQTAAAAADEGAGHSSEQFAGLRVKDSGTGIPPDIQDRIFEPFFTTKEVGSGSGLGLSIVRRFMDELGGTLRMTSTPGQGTVFELFFRTAPSSAPEKDQGEAEGSANGEAVLYVEDNETVRHQTLLMLRKIGTRPIAFGTAREALEWARAGGNADLLLTDLVLPGGMSGLELATALRRNQTDLPVIITTGYDPRASLAEDQNRHFPVLRKPYTRKALSAVLLRELCVP